MDKKQMAELYIKQASTSLAALDTFIIWINDNVEDKETRERAREWKRNEQARIQTALDTWQSRRDGMTQWSGYAQTPVCSIRL